MTLDAALRAAEEESRRVQEALDGGDGAGTSRGSWFAEAGAVTFDYGNNLRTFAFDKG